MPENEARRIPGAEELRNLVERQEREALREDLARALQDELGEPLRRLVRQSLEEVVQQALKSERARQLLESHVTDRILSGVAAELRDAQRELLAEARNELAQAWKNEAKEILLGSLREEMTELVRQGIREGIQDVRFRRALIRSLRETHEEERRPEPPPVREPHARNVSIPESKTLSLPTEQFPQLMLPERRRWLSFSSFLAALRSRRQAWIGGGAALVLVGLAVPAWFVVRSQERSLPAGLQEAPALSIPNGRRPVDPLREIWLERMTSREIASFNPLTKEALARYSFDEQFDCWFDSPTQSRLDDLLRPAYSGDLRSDLREAFSWCVHESYGSSLGYRLPVLGAQVIVLDLLRSSANQGWKDHCRSAPAMPLPDFAADGGPGPKTFKLLNDYLTCSNLSSRLKIDDESSAPEYLFVLYAALKGLEDHVIP